MKVDKNTEVICGCTAEPQKGAKGVSLRERLAMREAADQKRSKPLKLTRKRPGQVQEMRRKAVGVKL